MQQEVGRLPLVEIFGSPEFYADGWEIIDIPGRSVVSVMYFVIREKERREIVRLHFPRDAYEPQVVATFLRYGFGGLPN